MDRVGSSVCSSSVSTVFFRSLQCFCRTYWPWHAQYLRKMNATSSLWCILFSRLEHLWMRSQRILLNTTQSPFSVLHGSACFSTAAIMGKHEFEKYVKVPEPIFLVDEERGVFVTAQDKNPDRVQLCTSAGPSIGKSLTAKLRAVGNLWLWPLAENACILKEWSISSHKSHLLCYSLHPSTRCFKRGWSPVQLNRTVVNWISKPRKTGLHASIKCFSSLDRRM